MFYSDSVDIVLQECRFLLNRRALQSVLPDVERTIPPLTYLEFMDTSRHRTVLGYPVAVASRLPGDLLRLVVTELGLCLADPDRVEDVAALGAETLRQDPYVRRLVDLLVRSSAHGEHLRLDSILWLQVSRAVAELLNHDTALLDELRRVLPREAAKGERYLVELLRLKGSNPVHHATVKGRVLRALFARNDFAISSVAETLGDVYSSPLYREMVSNRLVFTEKSDGLYSFFDLREAFLVRDFGLELDEFININRVLRAVVEEAYTGRGSGSTSPAEAWLLDRFVTDELLDKAGRLDLADAGPSGSHSGDLEEFPSRVAQLLCLQPEPADYLLSHLELFAPAKAVARRFDLKKDFLRRLKNPADLAARRGPYGKVLKALLRWDFLNTLRSYIRDVEHHPGGRLAHDGRPLRASVVPVDLESEREMYSRRRHGTAVFLDIAGFSSKATELFGAEEADTDFGALCIRQLLQVRRTIGLFRGRPQYFSDGLLLDVFPRALDALRYVGLFRAAFEQNRHVHPRPWDDARGNPFAEGLRVGLSTGDFVTVTIPREEDDSGEELTQPVGPVIDDARSLVARTMDDESGPLEEYDPLEVFEVRANHSGLDNRGVVSLSQTFREVAAALRLEGLPVWTRAEPDVVIAGRKVSMKNYRFQLIFDDPSTGQVVLVRRLEHPIPSLGHSPGGLFEYLMMWPDAFQTFLDRVQETERHQPALRRRRMGSGPATAHVSGPQSQRRPVVPPRRQATLDASEPSPLTPPMALPAQALNLPGEEDFQFPDADAASEIEQRLGLSFQEPLAAPQEDLALQMDADEPAAPRVDVSAPEDDLSGGFDWNWTDASDDDLTNPTQPGQPALPDPDDVLDGLFGGGDDLGLGLGAVVGPEDGGPDADLDWSPEPVPDPRTSLGPSLDKLRLPTPDEPIPTMPYEDEPISGVTTRPGAEASPSLLGRLDEDFTARLLEAEKELISRSQTRARPVQGPPAEPGERKERLRVPRPDFHVLFKDYVYFWIGTPGEAGAELAVGRRYRDVFFDLHRFRPPEEGEWGAQEAIQAFLRNKIRTNFVPQSLSYEALPEGAGELFPLSIARLEDAFDAIT